MVKSIATKRTESIEKDFSIPNDMPVSQYRA